MSASPHGSCSAGRKRWWWLQHGGFQCWFDTVRLWYTHALSDRLPPIPPYNPGTHFGRPGNPPGSAAAIRFAKSATPLGS